jgi:pimeloyl-ACP methyl ester carboxylesterase
MSEFIAGDRVLYFEESGPQDAPAILLIAPGGMKSTISFWQSTPWNPIEQLSADFRVVAMDQRNAGRSRAPVSASDGWHTYTQDQIDLLDHLQIDKFHVAGMCIGGPYALGLIEAVPERVLSATLFQTIGRDNNQAEFYAMFDDWAGPLAAERDASPEDWQSFRENMYGGDKVFFNLDADFLNQFSTPLIVLMGDDVYHPQSSSRLVAEQAKNVEFIQDWKQGAARDGAMSQCKAFLEKHS